MPAPDPGSVYTPTVSVIVPCYNLGRYLDEAIESVQAQTVTDVEILVVDDGSTDEETRRIVAAHQASAETRFKVAVTENRGLPSAKNFGLTQTSGAYVCMLDADDKLAPQFLEKSIAALDDDPSLSFVSHWFRTFGDEVWEWTPTSCDFPTLLDTNTVNGAALVRRSALEAVGGFDETMRDGCEDWDVWISLVEQGFRGRILPEVLFYYRRRPDSMSRTMMEGDRHPQLFRRLVEKHSESYRTHLGSVLRRRENDLMHLQRHIGSLEDDHYRQLAPVVVQRRDDVAMFERRLEREREHAAAERAATLEADVARLHAEVLELRRSSSWRVAAPLRWLYDALRWVSGRRS